MNTAVQIYPARYDAMLPLEARDDNVEQARIEHCATYLVALFNEAESVEDAIDEGAEEIFVPAKRPWQAQAAACRSAACRNRPRTG